MECFTVFVATAMNSFNAEILMQSATFFVTKIAVLFGENMTTNIQNDKKRRE